MRQRLACIAVASVMATLLMPAGQSAAAPTRDLSDGLRLQIAAGLQVAPKGSATNVNPFTALTAEAGTIDKSSWNTIAKLKSAQRAAARERANLNAAALPPLIHDEAEPRGFFGSNDSHATAELIKGFGTGRGENNRARILGQNSPQAVTVTNLATFAEDNGSIPLASNPGVTSIRTGARTTGTVGDGPHGATGTGNGDFDFYRLDVTAGQQLIADTDTPVGPLDTVLGLYDSAGTLIASNDDSGGTLDSLLTFTFAVSGTYYVMVSGFGFGTIFPADPFDSSSGFGLGSQGPYEVQITAGFPDRDFFAIDLDAGDTVGASVGTIGNLLTVRDPSGRVVIGSDQDVSFLYPPNSPLPGGGNAVLGHVAARSGRYTIEVGASAGFYDTTLEVYRPGTESKPNNTVQTLFLDFDGARVNTAIWGGPGVRQLSPLAGFLGRWGLSAADENAVINQVIASVRESIAADSMARGTNPRFALRILNSRDHADPFGQPNVHRVIVGGTIAESGINTIGIAQFIDPGNFGTEDSAVVLLDVLSNPTGAASLNTYLTPASNRTLFVGRAIGNVVAHEAGHMYGNYHTDPLNGVPNLMDAGGAFPGLFGVGPDNIGGTADDVDYDFGEDTFFPSEGLMGTEDTLNTTAWALTRGRLR